jgi:hypothetical protein
MAIPSKDKGAGHGGLGGTADEYANGGSRSLVPAGGWCSRRTGLGTPNPAMADAMSGGLRRQATVQTDA